MDNPKASRKLTPIKQLIVDVKTTDKVATGTMPYDQGDSASKIRFELQCTNLPLGSMVGFRCDKPGPSPIITLQDEVSELPVYTTALMSFVPADYKGSITIYAGFRQPPPAGASFSLNCYVIE